MPLGTTPLSNFYTGISQQPATLKLASSAEDIKNGWLSVVTGASKRPPSEHRFATGISTSATSVFSYLIDRNSSYSYQVLIDGTTLKVFDLTTGVAQTVNFPDGTAYLTATTDPVRDFRAATIGDTTFILNRTVTVEPDDYGEIGPYAFTYTTVVDYAHLPSSPTTGQYVYVSSEDNFYQYQDIPAVTEVDEWYLQGTVNWQLGVPAGYTQVSSLPQVVTVGQKICVLHAGQIKPYYYWKYQGIVKVAAAPATHGWVKIEQYDLPRTVAGRLNPNKMGTIMVLDSIANVNYSVYLNNALIANYLSPKAVDAASSIPGTQDIASNLISAMTSLPTGVTVTRYGSTISFSGLKSTDTLVAQSTRGDKIMRAYTQEIDDYNNLPPNEAQGRIVRVKGDAKTNGDDYFVRYDNGLWIETYGYSQASKPLAGTMPYVLVREADETWTFRQFDWDTRIAGDMDSNPNPSFFGFTLNDIFFYSNRLGFVADTNVILSEANNYHNFYRTTLVTLVDNDVIDVTVLEGVDTLYFANPYNDDLLLSSDRMQYRLSYSNYLGPKNFQIKFSTAFNMGRDVHPVNMGGSLYFVDDREEYSFAKIFEFYPKGNYTGDDADDATGPVPSLIPQGIACMDGSTRLRTVAVVSKNAPNSIYMYHYFWNGQQKIQNAWCVWELPDVTKVHWVGFSFNYLYMVVQRPEGIFTERFYIDETVSKDSDVTRYLIDRQITEDDVTVSYNATTNQSTITLPFAYSSDVIEVLSNGPDWTDARHTVTKVDSTHIKVDDYDLTTATRIRVGIPYTFSYTFSTPYIRQPTRTGEVVVLDGQRLQMKSLTLQTVDTAFFSARVSYPGRSDIVIPYEAIRLDDPNNLISGPLGADRKIRIPVMGNNTDLKLSLENDSPWNSQFTSAEWTFTFNMRNGRRM